MLNLQYKFLIVKQSYLRNKYFISIIFLFFEGTFCHWSERGSEAEPARPDRPTAFKLTLQSVEGNQHGWQPPSGALPYQHTTTEERGNTHGG